MLRFASLALLGVLATSSVAHAAVEKDYVEHLDLVTSMEIDDWDERSKYCLWVGLYWETASTGAGDDELEKMADSMVGRVTDRVRYWGAGDMCDSIYYMFAGQPQYDFARDAKRRRPPDNENSRRAKRIGDRAWERRGANKELSRFFFNPNPKLTRLKKQCQFWREYAFDGWVGRHKFFRPPTGKSEAQELARGDYPECQAAKAKVRSKFAKVKTKAKLASLKKKGKKYARK